jgi:SAM-dependent methyltransferase
MMIVRCPHCEMASVAFHPADLSVLYGDEYYQSVADDGYGYLSYDEAADACVPWASRLAQKLVPRGKVLDIGCANGRLLEALGEGYERYGIEVNSAFVDESQARGVNVIARDIADPCLQLHAHSFDLITALAVLEHVADIGAAVRVIATLLKPSGIAIVQTPLVSADGPDAPWFTSSFEHISYPTISAMRYLFDEVAGLHLVGEEVIVQGFGSEFLGLATPDATVAADMRTTWDRLRHGRNDRLAHDELVFRFMFECLYLANQNPETLSLLPEVLSSIQPPSVLARITQLWIHDRQRADSVGAIEGARDWHAEQSRRWQESFDAVAEARDWHAEQSRRWQESFDAVAEARDWHAEQSRRWQEEYRRTNESSNEAGQDSR